MLDIIEGHIHELIGDKRAISNPRLRICKKCPLRRETFLGAICNDRLWLDPKTNQISTRPIDGYVKGCGCRLDAKTTLANATCPAGKW